MRLPKRSSNVGTKVEPGEGGLEGGRIVSSSSVRVITCVEDMSNGLSDSGG